MKRAGGLLYNLQLLRAVAAILVVTHHLNKVLLPTGLDEIWYNPGKSGVDIFFVISGFVMVHTMSRHPVGPGEFLSNRLIRVVPMYWLFTLGLAAGCTLLPSLFATTRVSASELIQSLLFVPYRAQSGVVNPLLFVGWTLNYEMVFYVLFAASIAVAGRRPERVIVLTLAAIAMLIAIGAVVRPTGTVTAFYTAPILGEFAAGMMLGLAWNREVVLPKGLALLLLLTGSAALLALSLFVPEVDRAIVLGIPATMIVAGALWIERYGWRWQGRTGQLLGASSYALYLTHTFVVMGVAKLSVHIASGAVAWVLAVISIGLSIGVGIAVHVLIERPLTDWLRYLARHRPMAVEALDPTA